MTRRVVFAQRAEQQIESLFQYIEDAAGTERTERFVGAIISYCLGLANFPERGTRRDDIRPGLRLLGYRRRATIALVVEADAVVILGIYVAGQDFSKDFESP